MMNRIVEVNQLKKHTDEKVTYIQLWRISALIFSRENSLVLWVQAVLEKQPY